MAWRGTNFQSLPDALQTSAFWRIVFRKHAGLFYVRLNNKRMVKTNLTYFRVPKNKDFTVISNYFLEDSSLSGTAKGVLAYILSCDRKKKDWILYKQEIIKHFSDGKDSISTALKNLQDRGYLEITSVKNGRKTQLFFTVYEIPKDFFMRNFSSENPTIDNSCEDFQKDMSGISISNPALCAEKSPLLNTFLNTTTNYSESSSSEYLRKVMKELNLCVTDNFYENFRSFSEQNNLSDEQAESYIRWIYKTRKKSVSNMNAFIFTTACKESLLEEFLSTLQREEDLEQKAKPVFCKHCGKEQTFQEQREACCHGCGKDYMDFSQFANIHALQQ